MTIGEVQKLSSSEGGFQQLYNSLPEPYYPDSINTDPDSPNDILNEFNARQPSENEMTAMQDDLISLAKLGQVQKI